MAKMILIGVCFLTFIASPGWSIEVGEPMPRFALQTLDGRPISHTSLKGNPLLLVFWNTWCPVCMKELPAINRLAREWGRHGVMVLAINTAINDTESKARAYWEKSGYLFPTGFDQYFEIGTAFKVMGVPTLFLINAKGVVRYKYADLPRDMEERLKQLSNQEQ